MMTGICVDMSGENTIIRRNEMDSTITDIYRGWTISVIAAENQCSSFSFDITSPSGATQHVAMGGITEQRAVERAREMIDMEISLAEDE